MNCFEGRLKAHQGTISGGPTPETPTASISRRRDDPWTHRAVDFWKPTPELRFEPRIMRTWQEVWGSGSGGVYRDQVRKILQQAWINDDGSKKEWRDVPEVGIMSHDRDLHQP